MDQTSHQATSNATLTQRIIPYLGAAAGGVAGGISGFLIGEFAINEYYGPLKHSQFHTRYIVDILSIGIGTYAGALIGAGTQHREKILNWLKT
jgi:hypothetical protein